MGHISPEAYAGGPIALVEEGDLITLNIPERRLELHVSEEELEKRQAAYVRPVRPAGSPFLARYRAAVSGVWEGAVLKDPEE